MIDAVSLGEWSLNSWRNAVLPFSTFKQVTAWMLKINAPRPLEISVTTQQQYLKSHQTWIPSSPTVRSRIHSTRWWFSSTRMFSKLYNAQNLGQSAVFRSGCWITVEELQLRRELLSAEGWKGGVKPESALPNGWITANNIKGWLEVNCLLGGLH